jgi:Flp pilus assembly protein TadG
MRLRVPRRGTRGQSLVEFALVLPIFLLLLFGVIDGGRVIFMHTTLSQAAREAARVASVEASWINSSDAGCGATNGPACPASVPAMRSDILAAANRNMQPFAPLTDAQLQTRCDPSGGAPTGNWAASSCTSKSTGNIASIRVTADFVPITPIISRLIGAIPMSGSASMVIN